MNDRSATTTKDTLFRATSIQPATLIRTFAVGLHQGQRTWFPRKQAGHMTASRQPVQNVAKKTLANQGRPHMARRGSLRGLYQEPSPRRLDARPRKVRRWW